MKSRARREERLRGRVGRAMTMLLQNGWIVPDGRFRRRVSGRLGARRVTGWSRRSATACRPTAEVVVDLGGAVVTPGLVNTHHHLYQTLTRARAQEATSSTGCASSTRSGRGSTRRASTQPPERASPSWRCPDVRRCSTTITSSRAAVTGSGRPRCRPRASWGSGSSPRGARWISASRTAGFRRTRWSSRSTTCSPTRRGWPGSTTDGRMVQLAVAPCSPFSVTRELMVESAELARRLGLRLHTHLAETVEEDAYCQELYGCRPVEYLEQARLGGRGRLVRSLRPPVGAGHRARSAAPASGWRTARPRTFGWGRGWRRCASWSTPARRSVSASTARPRTSAATCSSR